MKMTLIFLKMLIYRKVSFLLCVILFLLSAICFQFCRTFALVELLILGRLIVGFASGLTTTTMPMYLTELAPLELRGVLGVLCSMGVTGFYSQYILYIKEINKYIFSFLCNTK